MPLRAAWRRGGWALTRAGIARLEFCTELKNVCIGLADADAWSAEWSYSSSCATCASLPMTSAMRRISLSAFSGSSRSTGPRSWRPSDRIFATTRWHSRPGTHAVQSVGLEVRYSRRSRRGSRRIAPAWTLRRPRVGGRLRAAQGQGHGLVRGLQRQPDRTGGAAAEFGLALLSQPGCGNQRSGRRDHALRRRRKGLVDLVRCSRRSGQRLGRRRGVSAVSTMPITGSSCSRPPGPAFSPSNTRSRTSIC